MQSGPGIDIRSLRPKTASEKVKTQHDRDMALVRSAAARAGISTTQSARIVLEMVSNCMINRLNAMARHDPECMAYAKVLDAIGNQENVSRQAVKMMFKHYNLEEVEVEG
ncbi:MAG: hypothetical protein HGJ94_14025 [Desulfosarcina sp.]|nr:hypothetical protein [Desulfosarcina sp.]MBC2741551.1 hypothetical protein [Desulfosarcina sp.]MBC2764465.1 hypothetical protein [Desulfosarcina sp.]